jgi:formylglycine-generating enzyme required for sulfatase activity
MEFERRWWGSFPTGSIARHVKPISQERHRADVLRGNPVQGGFFPSFFIVVLALLASGTSLAQDQKDREFQECPECPIMVGNPSGTFVMGSPPTESGRFDSEGPQHTVSIKAFALGKYDVTSEEFLTFLRETGYQPAACNPILDMKWHSPGRGRAYSPYYGEPLKWPAVCLDWRDAEAYITWLNVKARLAHPAPDRPTGPYRLPTEAEWEYAARAGTTTARWWGNDVGIGKANCNGCGSKWDNRLLADVDSFAPNPFGLYGMLGNAWQWTADCWHPNYVRAPEDGSAWTEKACSKYVIRGGSWDNLPIFVRSATRSRSGPGGAEYDYSSLTGFRVARNLP